MESESTAVKTDTQETPRIYVASLADYNAGRLHGRWIEADQSAEDIREEIHAMLGESTEAVTEDWAIHDYEHFGGLRLNEFEDIDHVAAVARGIVEHGAVFAGLVSHFGGTQSVDEAERHIEEGYRGAFDRLADYAQEMIEDCYSDAIKALPEFIRYRIDYEGIANDLEMGGDIFTVECNHQIHVFDAHI
ncbi:MAG: antirestriction protein ArdA [Phycisphaerales bacterium]|nr:antirestriction protein ArdA [Phycisphaerales bacterium]